MTVGRVTAGREEPVREALGQLVHRVGDSTAQQGLRDSPERQAELYRQKAQKPMVLEAW